MCITVTRALFPAFSIEYKKSTPTACAVGVDRYCAQGISACVFFGLRHAAQSNIVKGYKDYAVTSSKVRVNVPVLPISAKLLEFMIIVSF